MTSDQSDDFASLWDMVALPNGQVLTIHSVSQCSGHCFFHHPMEGDYQNLPMYWRNDRKMLERICPHGVGHPDPNQWGYWVLTGHEEQVIHGCCWEFCCSGWYTTQ